MPDLNKKTMSRKNVVNDVGITVEVINDNQIGDGTSQETAQATVTYKGDKPPEGKTYEVHFELLMSDNDTAIFTDTKTDKTEDVTDENGVVTKYFTDSVAETGQLYAYVKMDSGGNPDDQKPFTFNPDEPDHIDLDLQNNGAIAGSGDYITAQVTATKKSKPYLAETTIYYQITPDDNDAQFYSTDGQFTPLGKKTTAKTDPTTGITKPSPQLKSSKWEEGTCHAWWDVSQENKPPAQQNYDFNAPQLQLTFDPLTTQADGSATMVDCPDAPAADWLDVNHPAGFTATAKVTKQSDTTPWVNGGDALFTLSGAPNLQLAPNQDGVDNKDLPAGQYYVAINDKGQASLSFFDTTKEESGTVSAYVPDWDDSAASNTDTKSYAFHQAWHGVSEVDIQYDGQYKLAWIYANGVQQAKIFVTLTLVDKNNVAIIDASMPDIADVYGAVKIRNYQTGEELGTGLSNMWSYTQTGCDDWLHETPMQASLVPREVAAGNNGKIQLTYYVTCSQGGSDVAFGLSVTPTGGQVIVTGETGENGLPVGQYVPGCPTQYFTQQHTEITTTATLSAKSPPIYDVKNSLSIVANQNQKNINDLNDYGPAGGNSAVDKDGNYWRQWDYTITFSPNMKAWDGTQLQMHKVVLASDLRAPNCFAEKANSSFFTYKGYLWPTNIQGAAGMGTAMLYAKGAQTQLYTIPSASSPPKIYMTLYMSFAGRPNSDTNGKAVQLTLYDQFANSQTYTFDQTNLPQEYDLDKTDPNSVRGWTPVTVATGKVTESLPSEEPEAPLPTVQRWTGEHVTKLGSVYFYNKNANMMITTSTFNYAKTNWANAFLGTDMTYAPIGIWASTEPTEGDSRFASTSKLYLINDTKRFEYCELVNFSDYGDLVFYDYGSPNDEIARCYLTPIWYNQTIGIVFIKEAKYLYYPGHETSPDVTFDEPGKRSEKNLDSNTYIYQGPFIQKSDQYQWVVVAIGT